MHQLVGMGEMRRMGEMREMQEIGEMREMREIGEKLLPYLLRLPHLPYLRHLPHLPHLHSRQKDQLLMTTPSSQLPNPKSLDPFRSPILLLKLSEVFLNPLVISLIPFL
jgi:hypothetical protein